MSTPVPRAERGFTLLEVLAAFVIAALALGVLARAALDGLQGVDASTRYQEALARAKSHLAAIGDAPTPSERQGDEGGGFHWHIRIIPLATASTNFPTPARGPAGTQPAMQASLLAVSVAISWGVPRRSVELDSERVVPGAMGSEQ